MRHWRHFFMVLVSCSVVMASGCGKKSEGDDGNDEKKEAKTSETRKTSDGATLHKSVVKKKGEKKTYTVVAKKGQLVEIKLTNAPATSSPVDYTVDVLGADKKRLIRLRDTNGGDGTTTLKTRLYAEQDGELTLKVYDWGDDDVDPKGSFELTVKTLNDKDGNEPNHGGNLDGNRKKATPLTFEKAVKGFIEFQRDEDWFKFTGKKNTVVEIHLTNAPATSTSVDYTLEMWDAKGKRRLWRMRDTNGSDGISTHQTRRYIPEDGVYYLRVFDWDDDDYEMKAGYTLTVKSIEEPDANEPNNGGNLDGNRSLARPLEAGKKVQGLIEYQADEDWFKVKLVKGQLLKVELSNAPATSSSVDYTLEMWNAKDRRRMWRLRDTDGSDGTTVHKTIAYAPADGVYYLRIFDWDNDDYEEKGTYSLKVEVLEDPDTKEPNNGKNFDSSKAVATPLAKGKSALGFIQYRGDADYYVVEHKGGELLVSLTNAPATTSAADFTVSLHDEKGKRLERVRDTDGSDGTTTLTLKKEVPAGKYYIKVVDWDGDDFGVTEAFSISYGATAKPVKADALKKPAKEQPKADNKGNKKANKKEAAK